MAKNLFGDMPDLQIQANIPSRVNRNGMNPLGEKKSAKMETTNPEAQKNQKKMFQTVKPNKSKTGAPDDIMSMDQDQWKKLQAQFKGKNGEPLEV